MTAQASRILIRELMAALTDDEVKSAQETADDPALRTWTYLPGDRPGLCLDSISDHAIALIEQLVAAAHSPFGAAHVAGAIEVERERRRGLTGTPPPGDRYWWRVIGDPDSGRPWGWRLNGHHVAVHAVVDGSRVTLTPHFIGSEPAHLTSGPLQGRRLLGPEEDLARDLLQGLRPGQRERALASNVAPADILTGADPVADPSVLPIGIRRGELGASQRRTFDALVGRYLERAPADYAKACWEGALDLASEDMEFAWAGVAERGGPHYYCVKTPVFLIEYDNTQDEANHAHSVWRHLRDDFGGDALRQHHRTSHT